jgi:hypothetical protein
MENQAETPESAADLEGQLLAFGDDPGDEGPVQLGQPESEEQPKENERRFVGMDELLPDDPNLPETYRGQKTVGELWQERTDYVHKNNRANQILNERDAELRAQRATIELLTQRLGTPQQQVPVTKQPTFAEVSGVDFDRELLIDPNAAMGRFATHLQQQVEEQVTSKVSGQIQELQTKLRNAEAKEFMDTMANASYAAAGGLNVPKEQWDSRVENMMSSIWKEANGDMRCFHDPRWWAWAHDDVAKRWVAPQQAATQHNPGTNTRSAGIRQSQNPLPDRLRKAAAKYAADFGLDAQKMEDSIRKDWENGKVT